MIDAASKEVQKGLQAYEQGITVKSDDDAERASTVLVQIAALKKNLKAQRDAVVKPLKEHVKFLDAEFDKVEQPILEADRKIRDALAQYHREVEAARVKEQARLDALREKQEERAAAKGKVLTTPAPVVERKAATVHTGAGSMTMRKVRKVRITDAQAAYSDKRVTKAVKEEALRTGLFERIVTRLALEGVEIAGAEVYEDFATSVRA